MRSIAVIGAGQAAQSAIETLRAEGYEGAITLFGDEPVTPYQRPPLSKKYLMGELGVERLAFRPAAFYAEAQVDLRLEARVAAIDPARRRLTLETGAEETFDRALIATGATPKRLPESIGGAADGVYVMRSLADADALAEEIIPGRRAVVVGGGYIGLEAAAVMASAGLAVTLLEAAPRLLARVASEETARYFAELHREKGVDVRVDAALDRLEVDAAGRVAAALAPGGERIPADLVIVGIGVTPNDQLARDAGLETADAPLGGIAVDAAGRSSHPDVFAAGDCAALPFRGARIRLESVQNAIDQAAVAARAMMGREDAWYDPKPWFWSDQYDVKLQIAGLSTGADRVVRRPGRDARAQSIWYFRGDRLLAVDAMNDPRAYMTAKRWLEGGVSPDPARVADPAEDLRGLA